MIRFVTNHKGGSNLQDSNGYLYRVSTVTAAFDRTYWKCVAKQGDSCHCYHRNKHQEDLKRGWWAQPQQPTGGETGETGREGERCSCCPPRTPLWLQGPFLGAISVSVENKMPGFAAFISNRHNMNQAIHKKRKSLKGYLSQAKNLEDLLDIPEQYATTADKKRFLLLNDTVIPNSPVPSAPRILVVKSDTARFGMWMAPSSRHSTHYSPR
jgi:hypothetical protein